MDTYLITLFLALLAFAIGLGEGILWQRAMDERHIRNLEGQRNDAHAEMVQQEWCCERMTELEERMRELDRLLAEIEEDEDDDWDADGQFLAEEALLKNSGAHQ